MGYFPMTKSAAVALLTAYGREIETASEQSVITAIVNKLEDQAKQVEEIAKNAYRSLGCTGDSLEDMEYQLSNKLIELKKETINLNGINLEQGLLKDLQEASIYSYDRQKEYDSFINYMQNQTNLTVQANLDQFGKAVLTTLWGASGATFTTGKTGNGPLRFGKGTKIDSTSVGGRFVGKFSDVFSNLGESLMNKFEDYYKKHKDVIQNVNMNSSSSYNGFQVNVNWTDLPVESFLQMTNTNNGRERDRFFKNNPGLKQKILNSYRQKILNSCPNISRKDLFEKALDSVMFSVNEKGNDTDAFFGLTGKNLIGRLGEVQALYYMLFLTDGYFSRHSKWIGGINNPHADELLMSYLGQFGIQVKNTISGDNEFEVNFQKFGITTKGGSIKSTEKVKFGNRVLPALFEYTHTSKATEALQAAAGDLFGVDGILPGQSNLIEAIETILGMYTFNIEYYWHNDDTKPRFYATTNPDFSEVRDRIEELTTKANQLMSLLATATMYMQTSNLSKGQSNTLYLIGGGTIISTATILRQIADDVRSNVEYAKSRFKMGTSGGSTIVDVLNSDKKMSKLDFALQSSYTFKL